MNTNIEQINHQSFEDIKQVDQNGNEFWYARALGKLLDYSDFRNFSKVIEKAKKACINSNHRLSEHIVEVNEQLKFGQGAIKEYSSLDFAIFQNHGYKGLYGGLDAKGIHQKKGLKKSHKILDYMGSTELAANLFRATQAEEKLKKDGIKDKYSANKTHHEVGKKVRQTIKELGGTMPEDLNVPQKSIVKIAKEQKKLIDKD